MQPSRRVSDYDILQSDDNHSRNEGCNDRYTDLADGETHCTALCITSLNNGVAWLFTLLTDGVVGSILTRLTAGATEVLRADIKTLVLIRNALSWLDTSIPASLIPALAIREHHWPLVLLQPRSALAARACNAHVFGLAEVVQLCVGLVTSCCSTELHL